jgi:hypothetical protein
MQKIPTLLLFLALSAPAATAQQIYTDWMWKDWEVTTFGGGSFGQTFDFPTFTTFNAGIPAVTRDVGLHYGSGYLVGANCRENLGDYWAADLQYTFANAPLEFTNLSPTIPSLGLGHKIHTFTYNGVFQAFSYRHKFRPYARAGAGASLFFLDDGSSKHDAETLLGVDLRDSWKFNVSYGGGFKFLFNGDVGVAFDARDTVSGVPSYGLPKTAQVVNGVFVPGLNRDGVVHNFQLSFGLIFRWNDWVY